MWETRFLGVEAPSSHLWPSRRALAQWACGQGADGPRSFLSHTPLPSGPRAPPDQLQLQSQTESCWGRAEVVSRAELPTYPQPSREYRDGRCGVTSPPPPNSMLHMPRERKQKLLNEEQGVQHPVLLPPTGEWV